jgi:hypothetical protein
VRIIFLNVWHGKVWDKLKKFVLNESQRTDVFCFVEVDPDLQNKFEAVLPKFTPIYHKGIKTAYLNGVREGRSFFIAEPKKTPGVSPWDELDSDMSSSLTGYPARESGEDVIWY